MASCSISKVLEALKRYYLRSRWLRNGFSAKDSLAIKGRPHSRGGADEAHSGGNKCKSGAFKMMPHYYFLLFLGWHLVLKRETLQGSRWGGEEKHQSFANTSEINIFSLKTRTPHVQNISLLSFILETNSWLAFVRFCENGTPLTMKSGQRPSSWKGIRGSQRWEW